MIFVKSLFVFYKIKFLLHFDYCVIVNLLLRSSVIVFASLRVLFSQYYCTFDSLKI